MEEPKQPLTPVPVRARHDGWPVERQYAFIEALAETGIVEDRRAQRVRGTGEHGDGRRVRAHARGTVAFAAFRGSSVRTFAKIRSLTRARVEGTTLPTSA